LADQALPIRAHRQAHADLSRAGACATEHEIGDVATCDGEQYERENTQQADHERLIRVAIDTALQLGQDGRSHGLVELWITCGESGEDRRRFGAGRISRHTGLQPSLDGEHATPAIDQLRIIARSFEDGRHHRSQPPLRIRTPKVRSGLVAPVTYDQSLVIVDAMLLGVPVSIGMVCFAR